MINYFYTLEEVEQIVLKYEENETLYWLVDIPSSWYEHLLSSEIFSSLYWYDDFEDGPHFEKFSIYSMEEKGIDLYDKDRCENCIPTKEQINEFGGVYEDGNFLPVYFYSEKRRVDFNLSELV